MRLAFCFSRILRRQYEYQLRRLVDVQCVARLPKRLTTTLSLSMSVYFVLRLSFVLIQKGWLLTIHITRDFSEQLLTALSSWITKKPEGTREWARSAARHSGRTSPLHPHILRREAKVVPLAASEPPQRALAPGLPCPMPPKHLGIYFGISRHRGAHQLSCILI